MLGINGVEKVLPFEPLSKYESELLDKIVPNLIEKSNIAINYAHYLDKHDANAAMG